MDNDAHELAALMMRRLADQDRKIADLEEDAAERRKIQAEILEMLRTMGDTCYAVAAAAERLTAEL